MARIVLSCTRAVMPQSKPHIPIILGPTASGKTAVSIHLARLLEAEIISADSRQIFRHLDIGTAKPDLEERGGISHHLIDVVSPNDDFTVAEFQKMALEIIADICSRGENALVVGGTGLYIRALVDNPSYQGLPPDPELRDEIHDEIESRGAPVLYAELKKIDPEAAAKIHPNNIPRLVRAIEVIRSTGRKFSEVIERDNERPGESPYGWDLVGLTMERGLLYRRIDERVVKMIEDGWVDEVRNILESGYDGSEKPLMGLGYKDIVRVVKGEIGLDAAIEAIQRDTRRFAKRQMTYFRQLDGIHWIELDENSDPSETTTVIGRILENFCV